jgi:hypothetical protein
MILLVRSDAVNSNFLSNLKAQMRNGRGDINKRNESTFIAVFAFFVVGSAPGESPAKVRITTWNLESFPNGSPSPEKWMLYPARRENCYNKLVATPATWES